ncbi:MAG: hypothetical protein FWC40_06775 [Proteobacteria bacterium]|nr:hypothetical protein [Pseudomonadota bacterium]
MKSAYVPALLLALIPFSGAWADEQTDTLAENERTVTTKPPTAKKKPLPAKKTGNEEPRHIVSVLFEVGICIDGAYRDGYPPVHYIEFTDSGATLWNRWISANPFGIVSCVLAEYDPAEARQWLADFEALGTRRWRETYENSKGFMVGACWKLVVEYSDDTDTESYGYDAYPSNYGKLQKLLMVDDICKNHAR